MNRYFRILAIDPTSRGFGFAVMEDPMLLVDWGLKEIRGGKEEVSLRRIQELIELFRPDVIVIEDFRHPQCRRRGRVKQLLGNIVQLTKHLKIRNSPVPLVAVQRTFGDTVRATKHRIASTIASQYPEVASRLPSKRKPWQSEDVRMGIFDAIALAMVYVVRRANRDKSRENNPP